MKKESLIESLSFLTDREKSILIKSEIKTFEQLLYFFPFRYTGQAVGKQIQDIVAGENVSVSGIIQDIQSKVGYNSGKSYTKIILEDNTDSIEALWWSMPYIAKTFKVGEKISLTGVVVEKKSRNSVSLFLNNPKIERVKNLPISANSTLFAKEKDEHEDGVYYGFKKDKGFSIKKIIEKALKSNEFKDLGDIVPESVANKLKIGRRQSAIVRKHLPQNEQDKITANKYFAFEEIFVMQVYRTQEKILRADTHAYQVNVDDNFYKELENILPFKLTSGQDKVLESIMDDISKNKPMSRLVEGDVGSGKTILALAATLATVLTEVENKKCLQVAYIAPTSILAGQHFEFFCKILSPFTHLNIALLTSDGAKIWPSKLDREKWTQAPKSRVKKLLDDGRLNIVIGTHALFNKNILFEYLGLVIIDEQHRFGVKQRLAMIEKHKSSLVWKNNRKRAANDLRENTGDDFKDQIKLLPIPHLLSMSATPIPRTLAMTIYGDLDLSILDELPPGRKRAETKIIKSTEREKMYKHIDEKLGSGKQVYIISPRIKDSEDEDGVQAKKSSVEFEEKRIKKRFIKSRVGTLHGRQTKLEKEKIIEKFYKNEIDILISTTVVEVGISVPNATAIVIENSDTFGLAQLHQLRGRVERSTKHSYCFLVTESENEKSIKRLEALVKSESGFELAEVDLSERGPGSLIGNRQSGLSDIGMEAIKNRRLVEIAKEEARNILELDPNLEMSEHKLLAKKIEEFTFHEE